jgi:hypothetical protein
MRPGSYHAALVTIDRRTFLKYGLVGSGILALGGIGLSLRPTVLVQPASSLRILTEQEFSIFTSFGEALLDGEPGWPDPTRMELIEEIDASLELLHPGIQGEVSLLLGLLESALAGVVLDARITTFTGCSLRERAEILDSWRGARVRVFRTGFLALHGFITAAYFNRPEVAAKIGYPGVPDWIHRQRAMP